MSLKELRTKRSSWSMIVPIANLELTKSVDREIRIDRLTLVSIKKLPYIAKRLGIGMPISAIRKRGITPVWEPQNETTVGVLNITGKLADHEETLLQILRDELSIFNSSFLSFSRKRSHGLPSISQERPSGTRSILYIERNGESCSSQSEMLSGIGRRTDGFWKKAARKNFFSILTKILRKDIAVTESWRKDLRNASILVGRSQASSDPATALLLNMIALETLLTKQGDVVGDELPARAEAFLGWTGYWETKSFEERIRNLYQKRCKFVHQGIREGISAADVIFSDELILNLITNLVRHHRKFQSKQAVIEFSMRIKAERLLGLKIRSRPRTLIAQFRVGRTEKEVNESF